MRTKRARPGPAPGWTSGADAQVAEEVDASEDEREPHLERSLRHRPTCGVPVQVRSWAHNRGSTLSPTGGSSGKGRPRGNPGRLGDAGFISIRSQHRSTMSTTDEEKEEDLKTKLHNRNAEVESLRNVCDNLQKVRAELEEVLAGLKEQVEDIPLDALSSPEGVLPLLDRTEALLSGDFGDEIDRVEGTGRETRRLLRTLRMVHGHLEWLVEEHPEWEEAHPHTLFNYGVVDDVLTDDLEAERVDLAKTDRRRSIEARMDRALELKEAVSALFEWGTTQAGSAARYIMEVVDEHADGPTYEAIRKIILDLRRVHDLEGLAGLDQRNEELEAEVEQLRESLDWVHGRVKRAASLVLEHAHDEEVVEDLYDDVNEEVADALDWAEDGQDE